MSGVIDKYYFVKAKEIPEIDATAFIPSGLGQDRSARDYGDEYE